MDVRKLGVSETKVLHFHGPDKKPLFGEDNLAMTATIYGPGSKQYVKAQAVNLSRTVDQIQSGKPVEQTIEEKAAFLAQCTQSFSSNIEYDGLKGEELFRAVYSDTSI